MTQASSSQLGPGDPRRVYPPPIQPFEQRGELCAREAHLSVADRRPFEPGPFQPLPDQHQAGAVIDQHLHAVSALRAEHENRAAERILLQDRLHRRRQPIRAATKIDRARRDQYTDPRRWHDHAVAFNSRRTSPRTASSTPGPTRTTAPPISISAAPQPVRRSATIGTNSAFGTPASATAADRNSRRQL